MKIYEKSNDYFPVSLDLAEINKDPQHKQDFYTGNELVSFSVQNNLTAFQAFVLVVKNTFEGYLYLMHDFLPGKSNDFSLFRADLQTGKYQDLSIEFIGNLEAYNDGLRDSWNELGKEFKLIDVSHSILLHFILGNQLFRLPVSVLTSYDISKFSHLKEKKVNFLRLYLKLALTAQDALADHRFITLVNEMYRNKFHELILKLGSKENLLVQLEHKLEFANNPMITSEEELEKEFFNFFIMQEVQSNIRNQPGKSLVFSEDPNGITPRTVISDQLRFLYRLISKNCREAHTSLEKNEETEKLGQYFMDSNFIYNEVSRSLSEQFFQVAKLTDILTEVIIFRKTHNLSVDFADFTLTAEEKIPFRITEEMTEKTKERIEKAVYMARGSNFTDYKVKHLSDDELVGIHKEFLKNQITFLDQKIITRIKEIKSVMAMKQL